MLPGFDDNQPPCLRLTVVAGHDPAARQPIACVLEQRRGTLGRAIDNDLVLPDEDGVVSRVHAEISYHDGDYYLIDKSTNGTFLNEGQEPLERGRE